jgi:hypothetical protein
LSVGIIRFWSRIGILAWCVVVGARGTWFIGAKELSDLGCGGHGIIECSGFEGSNLHGNARIDGMSVEKEEVYFGRSWIEAKEGVVEVLVEKEERAVILFEGEEFLTKEVLLTVIGELLAKKGDECFVSGEGAGSYLGGVNSLIPIEGWSSKLLTHERNVGEVGESVDEVSLLNLKEPDGEFGGIAVEFLNVGFGYFGSWRYLRWIGGLLRGWFGLYLRGWRWYVLKGGCDCICYGFAQSIGEKGDLLVGLG